MIDPDRKLVEHLIAEANQINQTTIGGLVDKINMLSGLLEQRINDAKQFLLDSLVIPTPNQAITVGERVLFRGGRGAGGTWVVVGVCDNTIDNVPFILCQPESLPGKPSVARATLFPLRDAIRAG